MNVIDYNPWPKTATLYVMASFEQLPNGDVIVTEQDVDVDDGIEPLTPVTEPDDTDEAELPPVVDHIPVPGAEWLPDDVKNGNAEVPSEEPQ